MLSPNEQLADYPVPSARLAVFQRILRFALCFFSAVFLLLFLYTALRRLHYPFDLEWIESGIMVSVMRIAHGQGLYVAPSLDFVPYLYAPLYLYLAAAFTRFVGVGFTALRLVSILSTLGSCAVIFAIVVVESKGRAHAKLSALAAAGLFLACYPLVESFYDFGRVDSLFVFLFLLALFCTRRTHPILAALAWLLVFHTKQTALPIALLMLCADWQRPRRILTGVLSFLALLGASIFALNHATHGWYSFYAFGATRGLGLLPRQAVLYLPQMLLTPVGISLLLVLAALLLVPVSLRSRAVSFYIIASVAIYGSIGFIYAHNGATVNAMMPAYAWTAVLFGLALARLLNGLSETPSKYAQLGSTIVLAAAVVQLAMFTYNPGRYIPTQEVLHTRQSLIDQIRAIPGEVYITNHSWDNVLAGKQPHAEMEALGAVIDAPSGDVRLRLRAEMQQAVDSHRFSAFVLDGNASTYPYTGKSWVPADLYAQYPLAITAAGQDKGRFLTSQPQWIFLPCTADIQPLVTSTTLENARACSR